MNAYRNKFEEARNKLVVEIAFSRDLKIKKGIPLRCGTEFDYICHKIDGVWRPIALILDNRDVTMHSYVNIIDDEKVLNDKLPKIKD